MYFLGIFISFIAGFILILSKTFNMSLSKEIGVYGSNMINYIVGFSASLVVLLMVFLFGGEIQVNLTEIPWYVYLGGPLGAVSIIISNMTMSKTTVITTTIVVLTGQMVGSILIDYFFLKIPFKMNTLFGSILVLCGVVLFLTSEKKERKKPAFESR